MDLIINWILNNYIEIFGAVSGIIYVFLEIRQNIWLWPVGIVTSAVYIYVFFTGKLYADMSLQGYYLVISVVGWYWWLKGSGRRLRSEATKSGKAGAQGTGCRAHVSSEALAKEESSRQEEGETKRLRDGETKGQEGSNQGIPSRESLSRESGRLGVGEATERLSDEGTEGQEGSNQGIPSREGTGVGLETNRLRDEGSERRGDKETIGLSVTRVTLQTGIALAVVFTGLFAIMWLILDRFTDSPVPQWDSFITSLSIVATWMLARKIYEHWFLWIIVNAAASLLFFTRELYPTVVLYFIYMVMSFTGLKVWKGSIEPYSA